MNVSFSSAALFLAVFEQTALGFVDYSFGVEKGRESLVYAF